MNKVTKSSVGGYSFAFEEEAYMKIKAYLDELEVYYGKSRDGKEILDGIEGRLAELLLEKCPQGNVVSLAVAENAMSVLGKPSDIEGVDGNSGNDCDSEERTGKKLYRDTINKAFGGVCSGLAAYLDMDIALMRVLWVLAFFFGGMFNNHWMSVHLGLSFAGLIFMTYIILWICVPPARTYGERSRMKGEKGNVDEVQQRVKSGVRAVEEAGKKSDNSELWRVCWRIVQVFIGVILLITGTSGLFAGCIAFFSKISLLCDVANIELFNVIVPNILVGQGYVFGKILTAFVVFIPFIGMIYGGIMLLFELKSPSWKPGLWLFVLWIISLIALAMVLVFYLFLSI